MVTLLSKYPFLARAKALLKDAGMDVIGWEQVQSAVRRITESVKAAESRRPIDSTIADAIHKSEKDSVVSYAVSRLVLAAAGSDYYWRQFARGEARAAKAMLLREGDRELLEAAVDFLPSAEIERTIAATNQPTYPASAATAFRVSMVDFIAIPGTSLAQARLDTGSVLLGRGELCDLLEKAVFSRVLRNPPPVPQTPLVKDAVQQLTASLPAPAQTAYSGKYLALPCIKSIAAGVGEGKRYYASMALATACRLDGLPKDAAKEVMAAFVAGCRKATHPFTEREAFATLEWVYKRASPRFSCRNVKDNGLAPDECIRQVCSLEQARRAGRL